MITPRNFLCPFGPYAAQYIPGPWNNDTYESQKGENSPHPKTAKEAKNEKETNLHKP